MKQLVRALLPRRIRPRRILAGPLRGTWIVTSWHDYPAALTGRTERALLDWLRRHVRPGETWLDVGAQYGYTAFALARLVGPAGRVFAFEPVPATAGYLDQGRVLNRLSRLTVLPFGLAAPATLEMRRLALTRGMADATVDVGSGQSAVASGQRAVGSEPERPADCQPLTADSKRPFVTVPVARFDWLWPLLHGGDEAIHGVKMDVQGMEIEAVEGMRDALRRWRPRLVIELHEGVSRERIVRVLTELGYSSEAEPIEPQGAAQPRLLDNQSYVFHPCGVSI